MAKTDVIVQTADVELRTCKLTKNLLKQFPVANSYDDLRNRISPNIRSPFEDQRLKTIEAKYSTSAGATPEEQAEAKELAEKKSFAEFLRDYTVGWIHGAVLGDEHDRYLLVKTEPGQYVLYRNPVTQTLQKFKQVFVV
jgi:hypothetical protein